MSGARPDVVVVGAGAIGLASAWRLAARGAAVTVVDPAPGGGASTVAAGMLAPVTESRIGEEALLALGMASWALWPSFAAEVEAAAGTPVGYRADGTLVAALDADDRRLLDELVERQRRLGLEVTTLRGREARALEPALAPGVRAGAVAAGERSVDPAALHAALLTASRAAGVDVREGAVERVLVSGDGPDGRATGVVLAGGEMVAAPTVVLAAGSWSGRLAGVPDAARPPVRPVRGEVVTVRPPGDEPLLARTLRGLVHGFTIYLVPRADGRIVVGATVEEKGFDTTVTAGGAYALLRDALALVPGLDDAELVGVRAGLRPGSPDDMPMIGATAVPGLVVATGHYRNGILLTPITAEAVAAAVAGEPVPEAVVACDPRRFAPVEVPG